MEDKVKNSSNKVQHGDFTPMSDFEQSVALNRGRLNDIIDAYKDIPLFDGGRPVMDSIYFDTENGSGNIVATDAHIMAVTKIKNLENYYDNKIILFNTPSSYEKKFSEESPFSDLFSFDKRINTYTINNGKYPNYKAVLPKDKNTKFTLTVEQVSVAYEALKYQMGFLTKSDRDSFNIVFQYNDDFYNFRGKYLLNALSVINTIYGKYNRDKEKSVNFYFYSEVKEDANALALVITCGAVLLLVMPVLGSGLYKYIISLDENDKDNLFNKLNQNNYINNDVRLKLLKKTIEVIINDTYYKYKKGNIRSGEVSFNKNEKSKELEMFDVIYKCDVLPYCPPKPDLQVYLTSKEPFGRVFKTIGTGDYDRQFSTNSDVRDFILSCKSTYKINIDNFLKNAEKFKRQEKYKYGVCIDFVVENNKVYFSYDSFISVLEFYKKLSSKEILIGKCNSIVNGKERYYISANIKTLIIFILPEVETMPIPTSQYFTYKATERLTDENGKSVKENPTEIKNSDNSDEDKNIDDNKYEEKMKRLRLIKIRAKAYAYKRNKQNSGMSNFSFSSDGSVKLKLAKKPKNWKYYDTPYGRLLRIPSGDYVTNDKDWGMSAFRQSSEYNGQIFVFATLVPNKGYRPIDFDNDPEVVDYIENNILNLKK